MVYGESWNQGTGGNYGGTYYPHPQPYYPYPYTPQPQPAMFGWQCPRCNKVWSPTVASCDCPSSGSNWYATGTNDSNVTWTFNLNYPPQVEGGDDEPEGTPV